MGDSNTARPFSPRSAKAFKTAARDDKKQKNPTTRGVRQSEGGGVGKSTLASPLSGGRDPIRGRKKLCSRDFDLDQLTCVEWGRASECAPALEPESRHARVQEPEEAAPGGMGVADFIGRRHPRARRRSVDRKSPRTAMLSSCRPAYRAMI